MIHLYYGDNDYALTQTLWRMRDEFVEAHGEHSVAVTQGDSLSLVELPQLLQGASLFATSKLTIIHDASANKPVWDELGDFLDGAGEIDLVLVEAKPDKRTRTYKWLQKNAEVREFRMLDEREVASWLRTHARTYGIELHHDEANFLVSYVGTDQWRLHHDVEKLALAGKPISRQLIEELVDPNPQATAFELLDAVVGGRRDQAMAKLAVVRRSEDPYKFIGLLVSQLYALAVCKTAEGKSSQAIASEAGIHPYVAQKTLPLARNLTRRELQNMIEHVARADELIKTTGAEPWSHVETSIGAMMKPGVEHKA